MKQNTISHNYVFVSTKISNRSKPFKRSLATQFSSSLRVSLSAYLSKDLPWLLVCRIGLSSLKEFSAPSEVCSSALPRSRSVSKFQVLQAVLCPQLCTAASRASGPCCAPRVGPLPAQVTLLRAGSHILDTEMAP